MARTVNRPVVVLAHPDDEMAMAVAHELTTAGRALSRRPREFMEEHRNGAVHCLGTIKRLSGNETIGRTPVEVIVTRTPEKFEQRDFLLRGLPGHGHRRFCPDATKLSNPQFQVPISGNALTGCQTFGVFDRDELKGRGAVITNAANALAALITDRNGWNNRFLAFAGGYQSRDRQLINRWVEDGRPFNLISACCLNATADRCSIVDGLAPEITQLLVRCAKAATAQLSDRILGWTISTFGPSDYDWLGELGITKVLLPYMWDADEAKVRADLTRNYALVERLAEQLNDVLPFPVRTVPIGDSHADVDLTAVIETARERAREMLPGLLANKPLIFRTIEQDVRRRNPNLSGQAWQETLEQEWRTRIEQEALLYLIDTTRYGNPADLDDDQPATVCLGLEVHGGYIKQGRLNAGVDGRYLPVGWLPQSVRQHWGAWALTNRALRRERARLKAQLTAAGY